MSYALVLTDQFLASFSQLDVRVQEVILDDLERLAEEAGRSADRTRRRTEAHWHRGSVEGARFDLVTALAFDAGTRTIVAVRLLNRRP